MRKHKQHINVRSASLINTQERPVQMMVRPHFTASLWQEVNCWMLPAIERRQHELTLAAGGRVKWLSCFGSIWLNTWMSGGPAVRLLGLSLWKLLCMHENVDSSAVHSCKVKTNKNNPSAVDWTCELCLCHEMVQQWEFMACSFGGVPGSGKQPQVRGTSHQRIRGLDSLCNGQNQAKRSTVISESVVGWYTTISKERREQGNDYIRTYAMLSHFSHVRLCVTP